MMNRSAARIVGTLVAAAFMNQSLATLSFANGELLGGEILNIAGDVDYGAYLAGECVVCHRAGSEIPTLYNYDKTYFVDAMVRFQQGLRKNTTMRDIALQLGEEEIAALATYFERAAE